MFKKSQTLASDKDSNYIEQKLSGGNIKKYIKGRQLGKGGFAKCFEVTSVETQKKYAAKVIQKATLDKEKARQKLTSQIKIHKSLSHPYIVGFQHCFEDAQFVYILLEKCQNQTLSELLKRRKRLTDIQAKYYIYQLVKALKYLHEQKIIHRDLKLGNLFLSDKLEIKIGDFGLATKLSHKSQRRNTKCGTPNYIAPEILDQKKSHSFQVDIWSLGVIAYTLLVGKPPFETNQVKTTYAKIKICDYEFPQNCKLSQYSKNFIQKLLKLDPSQRPTPQQILADPFLYSDSIPQSLNLATLACTPNAQFLQKYRNAELNQVKQNKVQSEERKKIKDKSLKSNKQLHFKMSTEKSLVRSGKALSAANLLSNNHKTISKEQKQLISKSQKVWISYWHEHPRYGLGYLLNSNSTGFRYNDSTCMIGDCKMKNFKYVEFDFNEKLFRQDKAKIFDKDEAKSNEEKKYKILCHFDKDLRKMKTEEENIMGNEKRILQQKLKYRETQETALQIYVHRYHRTSKLILFWLSNKAIQAIFEDNSEIIINKQGIFTYMNKFGTRHYFDEKDKDKQTEQIKKRYKHLRSQIDKIKGGKQRRQENMSVDKSEYRQKQKSRQKRVLKGSQSSQKLTIRKDFSNCK